MPASPLAGKPAPPELLVDVDTLIRDYYERTPDVGDPQQLVSFGTSGHRGTSLNGTFTEAHILAITQAVCEYRSAQGTTGPLYMGKDTHALSGPAQQTALEVLAANGVETVIHANDKPTPTPVVSVAILNRNHRRTTGLADGIVITPSHNPPKDGGFKYNPPTGGPADVDATDWIQKRANDLLRSKNAGVKRLPYEQALKASTTHARDLVTPYVEGLAEVVDMTAIAANRLKLGVDPLGGASLPYWEPIANRYGLDLTVVNPKLDPQFAFMTVDHDGQIRMDCSSPDAMAGLIGLKNQYRVAFGNDPDSDRHGIVTPTAGLMNPNHFLAVAVEYLFTHRPEWPATAGMGKTVVSSAILDRVAKSLDRKLVEVPVGFKWFVPGLLDGSLGFGGEESAGLSFLRRDGTVWTTDKDGILLALLASEIQAVTGRSPSQHYAELTSRFGQPAYARVDAPASREQKAALGKLSPDAVTATELAGEPITDRLTAAPGNGARIGGLKVTTESAWFAARPSGTEDVYKIYAESFRGPEHLAEVQAAAREVVSAALGS